MSRSEVFLDLAYVLTLGLIILALSNAPATPDPSATSTLSASSTLAVVPSVVLPAIALPSSNPVVSTTTLFLKPKVTASKTPFVIPSSLPAPSPAIEGPAPVIAEPPPETPLEAAAVALRQALVNIVCYVPAGSGLRSISGSGVIIDSKGIILTNTHIGQFFLLGDLGVTCVIRSGSPATARYSARPIYVSRSWLTANPKVITTTNPVGTGEDDYALLAITRSTTDDPLPAVFPFIPLATKESLLGAQIAIASYGSQALERDQVRTALFPTVVFSSVQDVYTFGVNSTDVLELGGSSAAQKGSSGGGVGGASGEMVGLIVTSSVEGDISTRKIHAITGTYIRRSYANETGRTLEELFAEPLANSIASFAIKIPALEKIITDHF